jgi:tRNA nucleotidyltransferase/poly(A) polymerase
MRMWKVGGCVRDALLGKESKDIDFAVEAESYEAMLAELEGQGFEIFEPRPLFATVRAHFPRDHEQFGKTTADFVLCRRDGFSSDGRRPDEIFAGTLMDDLARRDFTMNAIALDPESDALIDPFDGQSDILLGVIRFVGDPMTRLREDSLRALRALRFSITKGFTIVPESLVAIESPETAERLVSVSTERVRDELHKMFIHDTPASFALLASVPDHLRSAILRPGLKLLPTMGKKV